MAIVLAIALSLAGGVFFAAYNGTPHANNGASCGPIDILGYQFSVDIDCYTVSRGELLLGVACLVLAVLAVMFGPGARARNGSVGVRLLSAVIFLGIGVASLSAFNGTPHYGPTPMCAPIVAFGNEYRIGADCRVISVVELAICLLSFVMALILLLLSRPRRPLEF